MVYAKKTNRRQDQVEIKANERDPRARMNEHSRSEDQLIPSHSHTRTYLPTHPSHPARPNKTSLKYIKQASALAQHSPRAAS